MARILIAEDEPRIASFLKKGLAANAFTTHTVANGVAAALAARDVDFDLMILDLGLPERDGHQVLAELRARGERLPVLILTARHSVVDKVSGLDAGADDYLTKPFEFEELLARVRARLRSTGQSEPEELAASGAVLNLRTRQASVAGARVELSSREFALAETFFRHPGQVLSREQLLSRVWGYDYDPSSNVVDVYVGYLRKSCTPR